MPKSAHPVGAADLLVHGTYALRRALDRLAHPRAAGQEPPGGEHANLGDRAAGRPGRSPSGTAVRPWVGTRDRP
jgi:hypothetical protein